MTCGCLCVCGGGGGGELGALIAHNLLMQLKNNKNSIVDYSQLIIF